MPNEPKRTFAEDEGGEEDSIFDAPTVPMLPAAPSGPLEDDSE